jgi:hypothetical protein
VIVSKREKYIAIGTGIAVALLVLDSFVVEPYFTDLSNIATAHDSAVEKISSAHFLFDKQTRLQKVWKDMEGHGMLSGDQQAGSQLEHALSDWAQRAGIILQSVKSGQSQTIKLEASQKQSPQFDVISYRVTAFGAMRSFSQFLWALETAPIPLRVTDVRVTPVREGTDDLSLQLGVSTLSAPSVATPAAQQVSAAADMGVFQ